MPDVASSLDLSRLLVVGGCVEHLLHELWDQPHVSCAPQARLLKEKVGERGRGVVGWMVEGVHKGIAGVGWMDGRWGGWLKGWGG